MFVLWLGLSQFYDDEEEDQQTTHNCKQCDKIGVPSVCGSLNSLTPQLRKSSIFARFLCAALRFDLHKTFPKISDFRSCGVAELKSRGVTEFKEFGPPHTEGAPIWSHCVALGRHQLISTLVGHD